MYARMCVMVFLHVCCFMESTFSHAHDCVSAAFTFMHLCAVPCMYVLPCVCTFTYVYMYVKKHACVCTRMRACMHTR
jgi:hypothetical protein